MNMKRFPALLSALVSIATVCSGVTVTWDNGAGDGAWGASQGRQQQLERRRDSEHGDDVDIATGDTVNYDTAIYESGTELLDLDLSVVGTTLNITTNFYIGNGTAAEPLFASGAVAINHSGGTVVVSISPTTGLTA